MDRWSRAAARRKVRIARPALWRPCCLVAVFVSLLLIPLLAMTSVVGLDAQTQMAVRIGSPKTTVLQARDSDKVTPPSFTLLPGLIQHATIDTAFQSFYDAHAGSQLLGTPITTAFPTKQGLIQFFRSGALLLPQMGHAPLSSTQSGEAAAAALDASGILWMPLLDTLLELGSQAPVGGDISSLSYLDLRRAAVASASLPQAGIFSDPPISPATATKSDSSNSNALLQRLMLGHAISAAVWDFITRADVSPDGWAVTFGLPLTDALPLVLITRGALHRGSVQVFMRGAVLVDETLHTASGQSGAKRLETGVAYLETVGLPEV